ncbi:MAG: hypothetical protein ACRC2R_25415 [Xenococcaceae cyanobacterium]
MNNDRNSFLEHPNFYLKQAYFFWDRGDYQKAIEEINRVILYYPNYALGYYNRGHLY